MTNLAKKNDFLTALKAELKLRSGFFKSNCVKTIYFGGGTPSVLNTNEIEEIIEWCNLSYNIGTDAEITLEANPDDLTPSFIAELGKSKINRLSIGIQSFDDNILKFINRRHSSKAAIKAVLDCQQVGFKNISVDLIYGIPGLEMQKWRDSLQKVVNFNITHISAYHLGIEENTVFGKWVEKGKLNSINEEESVQQYEVLVEVLSDAGFEQYEISNFALPGWCSRHNSSYWQNEPYLGLGPSAHSYKPGCRQWNPKNLDNYISSLRLGKLIHEIENLSKKDEYNDYILTALRTSAGLKFDKVKSLAGINQLKLCKQTMQKYLQTGHVIKFEDGFRLSSKGFFIADTIIAKLFI